jgi:hypothetical protein
MTVAHVPYKHHVRTFQKANATDRENAQTLDELRCPESWTFRRLMSSGVIIQCNDNKFYLDLNAYQNFARAEEERLHLIAKLAVLLLLIYFIWLLVNNI